MRGNEQVLPLLSVMERGIPRMTVAHLMICFGT